jgi:hypothetical protein
MELRRDVDEREVTGREAGDREESEHESEDAEEHDEAADEEEEEADSTVEEADEDDDAADEEDEHDSGPPGVGVISMPSCLRHERGTEYAKITSLSENTLSTV